jgi:hypothetical protein
LAKGCFSMPISLFFAPKEAFLTKSEIFFWQSVGTLNGSFKHINSFYIHKKTKQNIFLSLQLWLPELF